MARAGTSGTDKARHENQLAFVLHTYPYRESSLLVEFFTSGFGRVPAVARGARRPKSSLRGVLLSFQPLLLTWSGRGDLRTLQRAESAGGLPPLKGMGLVCGFYINELLMRLLARDDPHEKLFGDYWEALQALSAARPESAGGDLGRILRRFETRILKEAGYALSLERDAETGAGIEPERSYVYHIERGPVAAAGGGGLLISGRTLLAMAREDYSDAVTLQQSKVLMRAVINHYLAGKPLHSRKLLKELQNL